MFPKIPIFAVFHIFFSHVLKCFSQAIVFVGFYEQHRDNFLQHSIIIGFGREVGIDVDIVTKSTDYSLNKRVDCFEVEIGIIVQNRCPDAFCAFGYIVCREVGKTFYDGFYMVARMLRIVGGKYIKFFKNTFFHFAGCLVCKCYGKDS